MQDDLIIPQECPQCEEEFTPAKHNQVYCSANCRQKAHRQSQKAKSAQSPAVDTTHKQPNEPQVETVRVTNPKWLAQQQCYFADEQKYRELNSQLVALNNQATDITEGREKGKIGQLVGFGIAVIACAIIYDGRSKSKPFSATMLVLAIALFIGLPAIGYYLGCLIGKQINETDKTKQEGLFDIQQQITHLEINLDEQQQVVTLAKSKLAAIPQYESEVSTIKTEAKPRSDQEPESFSNDKDFDAKGDDKEFV